MIETAVFYSLAAVTVSGALGVVLLRNVLHSAVMLGLCLLGVAGLFASLGSDFLFAAQMLVYVGGVAVLILFVVLLSGRASDLVLRQVNEMWAAAALICAVIFWGMRHAILGQASHAPAPAPRPTTHALGRLLLGDWAVPFELVSLILLAALTGAILFSKPERPR